MPLFCCEVVVCNKILVLCNHIYCDFQCQSNEGFWEISYMRVICNLLLKCQKKNG